MAPDTATSTTPTLVTGTAPAAAPAVVTGNSAPVRSFGEMIENLAPDIAAEFIGMRGELSNLVCV
jgi:hypothetical protein